MTGRVYPCGFPYPECNPPLVKDAADIADLRDLAVAVDTLVEDLATRADDILLSPDAGVLINTGSQSADPLANLIAFNAQEYDTSASGDLVQVATSRFVIQQTGFYYITFGAQIPSGNTFTASLALEVNGLLGTLKGETRVEAATSGSLSVFEARFLSAGDVIRFRYVVDTLLGFNIVNARACVWRMA